MKMQLKDLVISYQSAFNKLYGKYYDYKNKKNLFVKFYELLLKNDFYDRKFNIYDYLKCQNNPLYPKQLHTKYAQKNYENFLLNNEMKVGIKNVEDLKPLLREEINRLKQVLDEKNIKYKDFFSYKEEDGDIFPVGLFLVLHDIFKPYLFLYNLEMYKAFEELPEDIKEEYDEIMEDILRLKMNFHNDNPKIKQYLIGLNTFLLDKI